MRVRVLLVEDNDDLAKLLQRRFGERPDWTLTRARTREEALPQIQGDRFDCVVLDHRLPDGTGLELIPIIRASAPETPVLFLTAHGSEDIALQALSLGASDYMQKDGALFSELPLRLDALLARSSDVARAARVHVHEAHTVPVASRRDDHHARSAATPIAPPPDKSEMARLLTDLVKGDVLGAAVFDGAGKPIAALLPTSADATRLGAGAFEIHAQVGIVARLADMTPRAYTFILEGESSILGITTVAGRAIVAILVDATQGRARAEKELAELAARVK